MVLGVVVAGGVALLFIVVTGGDRGDSTRAGAGYRGRPNAGEMQAAPAASRSFRMPNRSSRWRSRGHFGHRSDGPRERRDRVVVDVERLHAVPRRRLRVPPRPPSSTGQGEGCQPWTNPMATRWPSETRGHRYDDRPCTYSALAARFLEGRGCRQHRAVGLSTGISCGAPKRRQALLAHTACIRGRAADGQPLRRIGGRSIDGPSTKRRFSHESYQPPNSTPAWRSACRSPGSLPPPPRRRLHRVERVRTAAPVGTGRACLIAPWRQRGDAGIRAAGGIGIAMRATGGGLLAVRMPRDHLDPATR